MLKEVDYCKVTMRKHFRKPLVMSDGEEEMFKASTIVISVESDKRKKI